MIEKVITEQEAIGWPFALSEMLAKKVAKVCERGDIVEEFQKEIDDFMSKYVVRFSIEADGANLTHSEIGAAKEEVFHAAAIQYQNKNIKGICIYTVPFANFFNLKREINEQNELTVSE